MQRAPASGFTYLGLLILLAVLGLIAAAGLKTGSLLQRAAAEEELLEIGAQFSEALRSYAAATPQGQPQQPPSLQELLKDPRFPNPRRHLRKIFVDPVTGKAEWGIVYLGDKVGVLGVYSLSDRRPLKVANFDIRFQNFENRERISDWKFLAAGTDGGVPALLTAPNSPVAPGAPGGSLFDTPPAGVEPPKDGAPPPPPPVEAEAQPQPEPVAAPEEPAEEEVQATETDGTGSATGTEPPTPPTTVTPPDQRR